MDRDLEESLKMFGKRYNDLQNKVNSDAPTRQGSLFAELSDTFTKIDVINRCNEKGIKQSVRQIIHHWKKDKFISEGAAKDTYKKIKKQ